ncbi:MAG: aldo/keto reductase [Bryobacterales bacterium]|nr:aldo/keto reductase [Bryobacterales bacterium]
MHRRLLGSTGLRVSTISLGTVELGMDYGFRGSDHFKRPDPADAARILHRAVELGINFLDTARAYGDSEAIIGRTLHELHPRPHISTKFAAPESIPPGQLRQHVSDSVESSLRALRVETIDLLQIHNTSEDLLSRGELLDVLLRLRQSGKIRHAGASLYGEAVALRALRHREIHTLQVPYNFLDAKMSLRVFPQASAAGVGILIRSAFLRGILTNRVHEAPAQLEKLRDKALEACAALAISPNELAGTALRFCLSHDAVSTVLVGVRTIEELEANVRAAEKGPLDDGALDVLSGFSVEEESLVNPTHWRELI